MNNKIANIAQFYLRIAIALPYLCFSLDRLGAWGDYGDANVSWGNWENFIKYAREVLSFLPYSFVPPLAALATFFELSIGLLLLVGFRTIWVASASFLLSLCFAISMTISFGWVNVFSYSVYTISAASLLLASLKRHAWSVDRLIIKQSIS